MRYPKQPASFIDTIINIVAAENRCPVELMLSPTRKREIVEARQMAMKMAKEFTTASLQLIGNEVGGKDHATVLHACKTVDNLCDTDKSYLGRYSEAYIKIGRKIIDANSATLVCEKCGSINVETKAWVNPNNGKIIEHDFSYADELDNWCNVCKDHTTIILRNQFIENQEKLLDE